MRILVLTSKDHIYANYLLRRLFQSGVFKKHTLVIWEQDAIVPGKTRWQGLLRYIQRAGYRYVGAQIVKQWLFFFLRLRATVAGDSDSTFYPYWLAAKHPVHREVYGGMKSEQALERVQAFHPDLILSLYSKEIIPDRILRIPRYSSINLHPAILPKYRGVSPVFWAMAEGATSVGITLHELDAGIDTGSILVQNEIRIHPGETEHGVYLALTEMAVGMVQTYISALQGGKRMKALQNKRRSDSAYYSLPTKESVRSLYRHGYGIFSIKEFI